MAIKTYIVFLDGTGILDVRCFMGFVLIESFLFEGKKQTIISPIMFSKKPKNPQAELLPLSCASLAEKKVLKIINVSDTKTPVIVSPMLNNLIMLLVLMYI